VPTQAIRLSLDELPESWRAVLQWGPCFCSGLGGQTCPSCANAARLEAAGLDWETEYEDAIEAGEALRL
jgi:hypothetical protein